MENEVGWYAHYCSYCDILTWMAQRKDDSPKPVNCRRCKYPVVRSLRHEWLTHDQLINLAERAFD